MDQRPLNICLISREYPPFFGGGIGTYTEQWSRALAAGGHRVVVLTVSGDGAESREADAGVTVVRLPFIHEGDWSGPHPRIATPRTRAAFATFSPVSVFAMGVAAALPRLTAEFNFDVIEAPETGALAWFALNERRIGRVWPAGEGPAIVTMLHSPTEWIAKWNRAPLRSRQDLELAGMERDSVLWSDGLLSPTAALADWARGHWGPVNIKVAPHPLGHLESVARTAAAGLAPAPPRAGGPARIVFAGRLEPRKGVDRLIGGFAAAVAAGLDAELDLVGEDMPDPSGAGLFGANCAARLGDAPARHRIRFHGRCRPERVNQLQDLADVVAVPAPMDNFPYTCMEAMARGRLVVAARAGGMAEMIRDGRDGILFEPGDEGACAAALGRAVASADSAVIGRSAASRILELCGNSAVTSRRVGFFMELIARRAAGRSASGNRTCARSFLLVNAPADGTAGGLIDAATHADVDFAHGWTRGPRGEVQAFGTPSAGRLVLAERDIGPLAIDITAASDTEIAGLMQCGSEGSARAASTWALALALLARGRSGAVVPEILTEVADHPGPARSPNATASASAEPHHAAAELAQIKASRGWRVLERVYDLLHVARGRGLRRSGQGKGPGIGDYDRPRGAPLGPGEGPARRNDPA